MDQDKRLAVLMPDWAAKGRVHDWRNYISDEVQAMWPDFTDEQRMALYRQADSIAEREEWE